MQFAADNRAVRILTMDIGVGNCRHLPVIRDCGTGDPVVSATVRHIGVADGISGAMVSPPLCGYNARKL